VTADFGINPKTVAHLWYTTIKQIPLYQPHAPIDPVAIVNNLLASVFDTKFKNAGRKPKFVPEVVLDETKTIDPFARRTIRSLARDITYGFTVTIRVESVNGLVGTELFRSRAT
jgi:hypothetical protein